MFFKARKLLTWFLLIGITVNIYSSDESNISAQSQLVKNIPEDHIDRYLHYLNSSNQLGRIGDYKKGETEIITNKQDILAAQQKYYEEFLQQGYSHTDAYLFSRMGVIHEDKYMIWIRDPIFCLGKNGKQVTGYNRLLAKCPLEENNINCVAVLAVSKEGNYLVNVIFRHATREWEIELPRGGPDKGETLKIAALRELEEETGYTAKVIKKLGSIIPDSGAFGSPTEIYLASELSQLTSLHEEDYELIADNLFLSKNELSQAFNRGFMEVNLGGQKVKAKCRDCYLASALFLSLSSEEDSK